jgi:hypothetical protein
MPSHARLGELWRRRQKLVPQFVVKNKSVDAMVAEDYA